MLNFGNKEFRNLQEQVLKNMDDIQSILQAEGVLNQFGIKVVGQETTIENLPTVADYKTAHADWAYGDTYAIGTQEPYTLYVLTRANGTHPDDYWFNIGEFPASGPQGPQGEQGPVGPTPVIRVGADVVTTGPGTDAQVVVTKSGLNSNPLIHFSFGIPRGENGTQGPQGKTGPQGPQGPQGIPGVQGDPGYLFTTIGQVDKETDLPDPLTVGRNSAMYVGTAAPYNVYVIIGQGSNLEWFNLGTVSTQIIPTYIFDSTSATSGTLNSDTLQEIINNKNAHAIRIGNNVFNYLSPGVYASSLAGMFNFVNVDLTTGAWTLTSQVVSDSQSSTVLIKNELTNINDWFLSTFASRDTTLNGYTVKIISDTKTSTGHVSNDRAKVYMKAMTGSEFVPMYNYNAPKQVLFVDSNSTIWKPQYMNIEADVYAIVLFKIAALEDYATGGTKLYKHYLSNFNPSFGPVTLYSTSPTPITMENRMVELPNRFNPYSTEDILQLVLSYSSSTGDISVRLYLIKQNVQSQFILKQVYGPMSGTKQSAEKIITSFTDTVTPL